MSKISLGRAPPVDEPAGKFIHGDLAGVGRLRLEASKHIRNQHLRFLGSESLRFGCQNSDAKAKCSLRSCPTSLPIPPPIGAYWGVGLVLHQCATAAGGGPHPLNGSGAPRPSNSCFEAPRSCALASPAKAERWRHHGAPQRSARRRRAIRGNHWRHASERHCQKLVQGLGTRRFLVRHEAFCRFGVASSLQESQPDDSQP